MTQTLFIKTKNYSSSEEVVININQITHFIPYEIVDYEPKKVYKLTKVYLTNDKSILVDISFPDFLENFNNIQINIL